LLPRAVEELLRLLSPTTTVPKCLRDGIARDDLWIRPGEVRRAFLGAANRDPDAFSDPDRLRIDRQEARHLAFGAGRHFCLGAPLARLNAEVALGALLCRYNGIRLTDEPAWRSAMPVRELEHVALAWEI
jgi:cytochrome P450